MMKCNIEYLKFENSCSEKQTFVIIITGFSAGQEQSWQTTLLSYPPTISLDTWLAVWTFSQMVSISASQLQDRGVDLHCG